MGVTSTYTAQDAPDVVKTRYLANFRKLLRGKGMQDICDTMPIFARDMVDDVPGALVHRKGAVRCLQYFAHMLADYDFEAVTVQVEQLRPDSYLIDVMGKLIMRPKKFWWAPVTWVVPSETVVYETVRMAIKGSLEDGQVYFITARYHNLPALPWLVRVVNGFVLGSVPHATEPLWGPLAEMFYQDDFYRRKRERQAERRHEKGANGVVGFVADEADKAIDMGGAAVESVLDVVNWVYETLSNTTNNATRYAQEYAGSAMDTARGAAGRVADKAAAIAGTVTETTKSVKAH